MAVVSNHENLEISFGRMIVRVKRHLEKCDLSEAKLFLYSAIGTKDFSGCDNFDKLMKSCSYKTTLMSSTFPFSNNSWLVLTIMS